MSAGLIDFFVLEASDYVDRLQRLAATDDVQGPDAPTFHKLARGLRGSATMARLSSFAGTASSVERGARLLHEGRIAWTPELATRMAEALAELRALIPMARLWGDGHDRRAREAEGRLMAVLDAVERRGEQMQRGGGQATPVRAPEAPNSAVTAFFDRVGRGVAAPVGTELGTAPVSAIPAARSESPSVAATTPASRPIARALSAHPPAVLTALSDVHMPIVPIASLAPSADADHVIFRAPNPAITYDQRFAADVSPLVGSLRARLAPLRQGVVQEASADMVAAFRPVLVSLRDIAASYQHDDIRSFCDAVLTAQAPLPAPTAGALDTALSVILQPDVAAHLRAQRLAELRRVVLVATPLSGSTQAAPAVRAESVFPAQQRLRTPLSVPPVPPSPAPTTSRPTPAAPSGRALDSLLTSSLEMTRELEKTPLNLIAIAEPPAASPPAMASRGPDGEPDVVPIDSLFYRGPRALSRARHVVSQLRSGGTPHDAGLIDELFDLVELAGSAS